LKRSTDYRNTRFSSLAINEIIKLFPQFSRETYTEDWTIKRGNDTWTYDTFEEFFPEYQYADTFTISLSGKNHKYYLNITLSDYMTTTVTVYSQNKNDIYSFFQILESDKNKTIYRKINKSKLSKRKNYPDHKFHFDILNNLLENFQKLELNQQKEIECTLETTYENETWEHDSLDEFKVEYEKADSYMLVCSYPSSSLSISGNDDYTSVKINYPDKTVINSLFYELDKQLLSSHIIKKKKFNSFDPIKIFIGHGRDESWKQLRDHLVDKQKFTVRTYESEPTTGILIQDIIDGLINECNFACLIMTAENRLNDGNMQARQNVIHEIGLTKSKYGSRRAIILLEEGITEPSNIEGIKQIRFKKGEINTKFGDVIAAIRREFNLINNNSF